jgi:putative transposase
LNRIKRLKKQVNRDRASLKRNTKNKKRRAWMLAKAKARRARIQENFQQKLTSVIAKMYKNVSIENLNIVPMINSYAQPGVIIKAAFYRFRLLLEQKMEYGERILHEADKALPSTRTCSVCGCVGPKVPLKERTFHCKECGAEIDRDLNAAINLARLIGLDEPEFKSAAADALNAALLRNGIETRQVVAESR